MQDEKSIENIAQRTSHFINGYEVVLFQGFKQKKNQKKGRLNQDHLEHQKVTFRQQTFTQVLSEDI